MDKETIIKRVKNEGLLFLSDAIKNDAAFNSLLKSINDVDVQNAISSMLISEGKKAKVDRGVFGGLFSVLADGSERLIELMTSEGGKAVLKKTVSDPAGEHLVLGAMTFDYIKAHAFVNKMLLKRTGRHLARALVAAAAEGKGFPAAEKANMNKLSEDGKVLHEILSSDSRKIISTFSDKEGSQRLINYIENNKPEAIKVIADRLGDSRCASEIINALASEKGEMLSALIGKTGFVRKDAGAVLWQTADGRRFVANMLKTDYGTYSIYALVTGMTVADFVAYTSKL